MGIQGPKSSKPTKPPNTNNNPTPASSRSSSFLVMVELKQRILTSLSKLADRDTHHIALEELESTISTLQHDAVPMFLNTLIDASSSDPKPAVKKEALRLLAPLALSHTETISTHLVKIVAHIAKRLRDPDSGVRDACRDTIGSLSGIYLHGSGGEGGGVGGVENGTVFVFTKPFVDAMAENHKEVQIGAAMCLRRVIECAKDPPLPSFQKLCPRFCKYLNSPNFFAKPALLPVVASLAQVGAISPHSLDPLLQSIHECLASTDWATRKAASDTLSALALNSSCLVKDNTGSTLTALEACRFDKIKPVRDSVIEALQLWKKFSGKEDAENNGPHQLSGKNNQVITGENRVGTEKTPSNGEGFHSDSAPKSKNESVSVGLLKKRVPVLTDKELNPEFFQKLEERLAEDLLVEVVLPRKCPDASKSGDVGPQQNGIDTMDNTDKENIGSLDFNGRAVELHDKSSAFANKGNWPAIQRQLLQLEQQQARLMHMFQDFMGGSHGSMRTLEGRVRGLERVIEDMVQDLSMSSLGRRGNNNSYNNAGYERSSSRSMNRYNNGLFDSNHNSKLGSGDGDGRLALDGTRGKRFSRRSDVPDSRELQYYETPRSGLVGSRNEVGSSRRGWNKREGPVRFGEDPSARSIWQVSEDEATLDAIRVAGDHNGTSLHPAGRIQIPAMTAEAMGDERERNLVLAAWGHAMDAFHMGDMDSAYTEVLRIGDEFLLVKLMVRSGPVLDQLSNEVGVETLNCLAQLAMDQNLFDLCLLWVQQLVDVVSENGPEVFGIPMKVRRELLLNFQQASSGIEVAEDWEGGTPEQLVLQLASAWAINVQHEN